MENKNLTTEDKTSYYYSNNQRIPIERETSVYAVKFASGRDPRDGSLSRPAFRLLNEDSDNIGFIPNYNFQIYKANADRLVSNALTNGTPMLTEVRNLRNEPSIEYATIAYRRNRNVPAAKLDDLMFVTREFAVQFKSNVSREQIDEINATNNVQVVKPLDYAQNGFVLRAPEADGDYGPIVLSNLYFESGLVMFAHPNFVQRRHTRSVVEKKKTPTRTIAAPISKVIGKTELESRDVTFLSRQWHLTTANVIKAWNITKGSPEIKIAILDDGVDTSHSEFSGKIVLQYDYATGTADGNPKNSSDNHGTACAGVATAKGVKASGAAPACSLIAVVTPTFLGSVEEGDMFKYVCDQGADIISCSWGPADGTGAVDPLPDNVRAAINYCVTNGRNGMGIPIFWAAGNGNESVSNDGYASNPDVVAVAASTNKETRSWYSDFGPEVFICAPSSGDKSVGELGIFTADRRGNDGYNPDKKTGTNHPTEDLDYTDSFGGTSSATPLVAGITGLMLSINPNLRVNDVKQILKDTADRIDTAGGNYDSNGHSNFYGYGRINACKAVENARDFSGSNPNNNTGSNPAINAASSISRTDSAPVFQIDKGGRKMFAVEVATSADLFNYAVHGNERTTANFYASWQDGMLESTPYTLSSTAWDALKAADRLYYRVHVADDSNWNNYGVTIPDDSPSGAPSIEITGSGSSGEVPSNTGEITITSVDTIGRDNSAPLFIIGKGGRKMYAVEVATEASLFNNAENGSSRNDDNFYASWSVSMLEEEPYTLPEDVWQRLKVADRLYFRVHVADDSNWNNYGVSVADSDALNAPSIEIVDGTRSVRDVTGVPPKKIEPFILAEAKKEDEMLWQQ